ncbi:hypothetical protein BY458DRAFT_532028 [Sporodiniella umbellata]|nr:hypothetical protein BY458DRAFT_532028 [Sporodiniella umbellata]
MSHITEKEKRILNSHREILWLQRQIEEYEQEADPDLELPETVTSENISGHLSQYYEHLSILQSDLNTLSQRLQIKNKLVSYSDAQYCTLKALYPRGQSVDPLIEQLIETRDAKAVEFLKLLRTYTTLKSKLTQVQADLIKQHVNNQRVHKEIQELKHKDISQVEVDDHPLSQTISETINRLAIVRGVFSTNIGGSWC